jgi:hypothetical protein
MLIVAIFSITMLSFVVPTVVMLSGILLNVVAPLKTKRKVARGEGSDRKWGKVLATIEGEINLCFFKR